MCEIEYTVIKIYADILKAYLSLILCNTCFFFIYYTSQSLRQIIKIENQEAWQVALNEKKI